MTAGLNCPESVGICSESRAVWPCVKPTGMYKYDPRGSLLKEDEETNCPLTHFDIPFLSHLRYTPFVGSR